MSLCAGQERTSSLPDLPETQSTGRVCFPTCSQRDSNSSKLPGVQSVRFKLKDKPSFVCFMYSWTGPTRPIGHVKSWRAAESEVFRWIRMNPLHSTEVNSLHWTTDSSLFTCTSVSDSLFILPHCWALRGFAGFKLRHNVQWLTAEVTTAWFPHSDPRFPNFAAL